MNAMNDFSSLKGKRCVVTGGAGFVGSHLSDALLEVGASVVNVDRTGVPHPDAHVGATFISCDLQDATKLTEIIAGADFVFHLAALVSVQGSIDAPRDYYAVNVGGTLNVLEAARASASRPRVILASSAAVYGDQPEKRARESMLPNPKSPYGLHKYFGERMAALWHELYGIETISIRPFNIYGTRMNPNGPYAGVIGKFMQMRADGLPLSITGDGTQTRDFVHVSDMVRGYLFAAVSSNVGAGEIINIASGKSISLNELATMVGGEVTHVPARVEIKDSEADITRAKELLDWEPQVMLEEGIAALKTALNIV